MASAHRTVALRQIHRLFAGGVVAGLTDEQLRERFVRTGDGAAFEALVARHGPMVLAVCRSVVRNGADAEDAFQATFLILVRKAGSLRVNDSLASWLYRVSYRVATRANLAAARRRVRELLGGMDSLTLRAHNRALEPDVWPLLYEEVNRLPEKYRDPVVLCYLEGMSYEEAASRLHWPAGTVSGRLARARDLLRARLTRRGIALSAGALTTILARPATACVPLDWIHAAGKVAWGIANGRTMAAGLISTSALALGEGALRATVMTRVALASVILIMAVGATPFLPLAPAWGRGEPAQDDRAEPGVEGAAADTVNGADADVLTFAIPATNHTPGPEAAAATLLPVQSVAYSPDGRLLAAADMSPLAVVRDLATGHVTATLRGHAGIVSCVAFSPDGKTVATASHDHTVKLWDASDGHARATLDAHLDRVLTLAFSPDGKTLASAGDDRTVRLWDPVSATELATLRGHSAPVSALAYSPDGKTVASAGGDRGIRLWNVAGRVLQATLNAHFGTIRALAFSPDSRTLASASDDPAIRLWNVARAREVNSLVGHSDIVTCLAFAPGGRSLASGSADATIKLWDTTTWAPTFTFRGPNPHGFDNVNGHSDAVTTLAFSPSGRQLASGGYDRAIKLWKTFDSVISAQTTLAAHRGNAWFAVFSPDGKTLATGGDDHLVRLWNAETTRLRATLQGHERSVTHACFTPDGKAAITSSADGTARIWDTTTGRAIGTLTVEDAVADDDSVPPGVDRKPGFAIALSPDGSTLATAGADRTLRLWDVAARQERRILAANLSVTNGLAFSPDGKRIAAGLGNPMDLENQAYGVQVWDVATGAVVTSLQGHRSAAWDAPFSPDGRLVASPSSDGVTKLWDTASWKEVGNLVSVASWVQSAAFAPDGQSVVVGHGNGTVTWWDVATEKPRTHLVGHTAAVRAVSFSPGGDAIASACGDGTVRLWRPGSKVSQTLPWSSGAVNAAAFSPDGKTLALACDDGTLRLCPPDAQRVRMTLAGHRLPVRAVAFALNGKLIATAGADPARRDGIGELRLWDAATGTDGPELEDVTGAIAAVALSPDDKVLAAVGSDPKVRLWDATSGRLIGQMAGHEGPGQGVAFSPDGRMLASASVDGTARLWDLATKSRMRTLSAHAGGLTAVAFSPDGQIVATCGHAGAATGEGPSEVALWDPATGQERARFQGPKGKAGCVAFAPDGKTLIAGGGEASLGALKAWDVATGHERNDLGRPSHRVEGLAVSPDGTSLVTIGGDVRVWSATSSKPGNSGR